MNQLEPRRGAVEVAVTSDVDWLLTRALGPVDSLLKNRPIENLDSFSTVIGAQELLGRIHARTSREVLQKEMTGESLAGLDRIRHQIVATELLQEQASRELAKIAANKSVPILFLKGMALRLGGIVAAGARFAGDVDVLVRQRDAEPLARWLRETGWKAMDLPRQEHHLPPMVHGLGVILEIHTAVRGVGGPSSRDSTFDACAEARLCRQLAGWPQGIFIPTRDLLLAHLIVHALGQHLLSPATYPQLQLLADLQDLSFSGLPGEGFMRNGLVWIESEVDPVQVAAVQELVRAFERGESASSIGRGDQPASKLLQQMLLGATDDEHRRSLKLEALLRPLARRRVLAESVRSLNRAIFLSRGQIDLIYGPPRSKLGYLGRRLWRPFDLAMRAFKAFKAQWSIRFRK